MTYEEAVLHASDVLRQSHGEWCHDCGNGRDEREIVVRVLNAIGFRQMREHIEELEEILANSFRK